MYRLPPRRRSNMLPLAIIATIIICLCVHEFTEHKILSWFYDLFQETDDSSPPTPEPEATSPTLQGSCSGTDANRLYEYDAEGVCKPYSCQSSFIEDTSGICVCDEVDSNRVYDSNCAPRECKSGHTEQTDAENAVSCQPCNACNDLSDEMKTKTKKINARGLGLRIGEKWSLLQGDGVQNEFGQKLLFNHMDVGHIFILDPDEETAKRLLRGEWCDNCEHEPTNWWYCSSLYWTFYQGLQNHPEAKIACKDALDRDAAYYNGKFETNKESGVPSELRSDLKVGRGVLKLFDYEIRQHTNYDLLFIYKGTSGPKVLLCLTTDNNNYRGEEAMMHCNEATYPAIRSTLDPKEDADDDWKVVYDTTNTKGHFLQIGRWRIGASSQPDSDGDYDLVFSYKNGSTHIIPLMIVASSSKGAPPTEEQGFPYNAVYAPFTAPGHLSKSFHSN